MHVDVIENEKYTYYYYMIWLLSLTKKKKKGYRFNEYNYINR